jgi:hypothetical protein
MPLVAKSGTGLGRQKRNGWEKERTSIRLTKCTQGAVGCELAKNEGGRKGGDRLVFESVSELATER